MQYWQRNNLLSAGTGGGALDEMAFLHVSKKTQIEKKYYLYWTPQRPILNKTLNSACFETVIAGY